MIPRLRRPVAKICRAWSPHRSLAPAGFTLLEILVAGAITLLLAALLLALSTNLLSVWDRAAGGLETASQAELILDQVAQDLNAVVMRIDSQVWFAATIQNDQNGAGDAGMTDEQWTANAKPGAPSSLQLTPDSNRLEDARFGQAGVWLRFFAAQPDANDRSTNRSTPRAVAYQVVRRRIGGAYVYQLYRSQVRPGGTNSTFNSGYSLFASGYTTPNGTAQNPGNVRRPNAQFLLGNNVIDFGLKIYSRAADGSLILAFPTNNAPAQSLVATTDPTATPAGYAGRPVARIFPAAADVVVRILTREGAELIANLEAGLIPVPAGISLSDYWWRVASAHSYSYRRHIEIVAQLL